MSGFRETARSRIVQACTFLLAVAFCGCGGSAPLPPPPNSLAFSPVVNLSSGGTKPGSVVLGDFNGDGTLDIAVSNFTSNTVAVFLNNGNGTFQSPIVSPVQISAMGIGAIAAGDFNQDGKADLVIGTMGGAQADIVLLSKGDGTFTELAPIPNSFGFFHARVADLNGDGHQDLVTGGNGNISVFLGHGDGTFTGGALSPAASFPGAYFGIDVGDFNGDHKPDIVVCDNGSTPTGTLVFYAGNGDGTLQSATTAPLVSSFPGSLAGGDFQGNGKRDLLIGFFSEAFISLGNGDGTFQSSLSSLIPVYSNSNPTPSDWVTVQAADLNQDGKLDALVADYGAGILNLTLNGALGKVAPATGVYQFTLAPGLSDMAVGDLNGDGRPDIVISNSLTNQIYILLSQ
ncbi:MAG: VCBS repeat-containing protein [Acidobacteriia bacterium]|nr:VCBS repeat-containing protein [Terriglobia bacterium]